MDSLLGNFRYLAEYARLHLMEKFEQIPEASVGRPPMKLIATILSLLVSLNGVSAADNDPAQEPAVQAVAKVMPAVVNINTERTVSHAVRNSQDDFFSEFFGGPMRPPRMIKQKVQSLGSGFLIDATGHIVTNEHVVERAAEMKISVTMADGKSYAAKYITGDGDRDLALIKIERKEPFPFIPLNDLSGNLLGQTCLVLGNPLGYGSSVARGILSAKDRTVVVNDTEFTNLLQTDAAINPGNSGGPIVDISGKLAGVSSVKMSYTPQGVPTQGIAFAIPAEIVREKVEEFKKVARGERLPEKPQLARKHFGMQLQEMDEKLAESFGVEMGTGVLIADVEPGSPASEGGFEQGQIIQQVGRFAVRNVRDVEKLLGQIAKGSRVDFGISSLRRIGQRQFRQIETLALVAR